jgi:hypothetical protein
MNPLSKTLAGLALVAVAGFALPLGAAETGTRGSLKDGSGYERQLEQAGMSGMSGMSGNHSSTAAPAGEKKAKKEKKEKQAKEKKAAERPERSPSRSGY